jgi:hypothetical protein
MRFTFGIITSPQTCNLLQAVVNCITPQMTADDEIIIIGGNQSVDEGNYRVIPFDETIKAKWITRKKNLITENARGEIVVYLHDYVVLGHNFVSNIGSDFDVCMTPILNADGTRFRDWMLEHTTVEPILGTDGIKGYPFLLPYNISHLSKFMYFSGSFWVAKRKFMEENPLDERLVWGEGEDVEWSKRIRQKTDFKINIQTAVKLLKYKPREFSEVTPEILAKLDAVVQSK